MYKTTIMLLTCFLMVSCTNQSTESNASLGKYHTADDALQFDEELEMEPPQTAEPPAPPQSTLEKGTKIIKNGFMNFEVDKLEKAKSKVDTIVKSIGGYYENEQFTSYGNRNSYTLRLRIPNAKFDSIINEIESDIGDMKSKNVTAKDVTEEFVDLNIRLENNLAYLSQYNEILRKAKSVKEILEVQEKIRRIEEEINSKKGRLKFLEDKVSYSTLNLEITELISKSDTNKPSFGGRLASAFNSGVQGFLSFVVGLVSLWPFVVIGLLVFLGRKRMLNVFRRKK